jgi:uncharacterized SAM-binding protein YcdF (DUF218 family)
MLGGTIAHGAGWRLTCRGWGLAAIVCSFSIWTFVHQVQPFFAVTDRTNAPDLVVEGWVHEYAIQVAAKEFSAHPYRQIYTTGGPVSGLGGYVNDQQTVASVGAGRLKTAGVPAAFVQMVPCRAVTRDRTYSSAVALRDWLAYNHRVVTSINVLTEDVHARRTRLLFQEAFGDSVKIGIISVPNPDYDAKHWWRYSEGVREIIGECIAYVYAKLFFRPSAGFAP